MKTNDFEHGFKAGMKKEDYLSYWLGVLEAADEVANTMTGNGRLHTRMRDLANNRKQRALQEMNALGFNADVAMQISRRGFQ